MEETRKKIFDMIDKERAYQDEKWGTEFDKKNTINDWITYICRYATNAAFPTTPGAPIDVEQVKAAFMKSAAIAVAALEILEEHGMAPRHYDDQKNYLKEQLYGQKFTKEDSNA